MSRRSLVHHVLRRLLKRTCTLVVQLLLLRHRGCAVALPDRCPVSRVRACGWEVVARAIHQRCVGAALLPRWLLRYSKWLRVTLQKRQRLD